MKMRRGWGEHLSGLEAFGKRQSQDLVLCALHSARPSCQVTEEEVGVLKTGSDGDAERGWRLQRQKAITRSNGY